MDAILGLRFLLYGALVARLCLLGFNCVRANAGIFDWHQELIL